MRKILQYDPDIGYRYVPHLKTRVSNSEGGYLVQTNALGFRSAAEFDGLPPDARRVLLFGDSFTAGDAVSNSQRFGDLIAESNAPLQVYNFGLPGTGTDQQFITYRKFATSIPCTAVIITVLVENIRRITSAYRLSQDETGSSFVAKPYFELERGELVRRFDPVPREPIDAAKFQSDAPSDQGGRFKELRVLVRSLGLKDVIQQFTGYQPTPEYDSPNNPAWLLMRAILKKWISLIEQPVILMPLPLFQHVEETADPEPYRRRFREFADEEKIVLHDPLPDLQSYDRVTRRSFRFKTDVHLTPVGHQAVAVSLSKTLARVLEGSSARSES